MSKESRIWSPIDYQLDGKQYDCLRLPHSVNISAYGWLPIPIICIKNGNGPTALLVAGSHGDEYEGQIALMNLAREINPKDIQGRIIIIPSLNFPAVTVGGRVSPLDEGNLNRSFPGDAHGTATQMIADYITHILLPMADFVVDLHSGGRSLNYVQSALIRPAETQEKHMKLLKLLEVFGAPISFISNGKGGGGGTTLSATAENLGILAITTELGGGATLSDMGLELAQQGVKRLLNHFNIAPKIKIKKATSTRLMSVPNRQYFVYATQNGFFEPAAHIGDEVQKDQFAGLLHSYDYPQREPEKYHFPKSGLIATTRFPTLTARGDCLYKLMVDFTGNRLKNPRQSD